MILFKEKSKEFLRVNPLNFNIEDRFNLDGFIDKVLKKYNPDLRVKNKNKFDATMKVYIEIFCHTI